jgi:hypothetical protein
VSAWHWMVNMLDLYSIVEFTADGQVRIGTVVGRTREEHPRYNMQVARDIIKDVPADKVVRVIAAHDRVAA